MCTRLQANKRVVRGGVAAIVAVLALLQTSAVYGNWLAIRRGGVDKILEATHSAQATETWGASFRAKVAKTHPLAKIVIDVSWRPLPVNKGGAKAYESTVIVHGLKSGKVGVATSADKTWIRASNGKVKKATGAALLKPLEQLKAPLMLFVTLAMSHAFHAKLEGEFGGTAVIRMNAKYAGMKGLRLCKIGISKRTRYPEMSEVGAGDGRNDVKLAWIGVHEVRGQLVPKGLRLMRLNGKEITDFERTALHLGKASRKLRFGSASLR